MSLYLKVYFSYIHTDLCLPCASVNESMNRFNENESTFNRQFKFVCTRTVTLLLYVAFGPKKNYKSFMFIS